MTLRTSMLAVSLASVLALPLAHAEMRAPSEGSPFSPSEQLAISVVLSPYVLASGVVGSAEMSGNAVSKASTSLSQTLSTNTEWTVVGMRNDRDTTLVDLQSADGKLRMTIGVPAKETAARGVRLQDHITMKRLGTDSFSAEYQGRPLGVISDPAAHLAHSSKRN